MIIWHSSKDRGEVEILRDKLKANGYVEYQKGKELFRIDNPKIRITTNKDRVHILWIGEVKDEVCDYCKFTRGKDCKAKDNSHNAIFKKEVVACTKFKLKRVGD